MQKKFIFLVLTGLLCLSLAGCGQSGGTPPEEDSSAQTEQPAELPAEETTGEEDAGQAPEDGADTEAPQYTDNFSVDTEAVTAFAEQIHATLTVMKDGEHWFHTPEQMQFLDDWARQCLD